MSIRVYLCITKTDMLAFGFSLMNKGSLSILHASNVQSWLELISLYPLIVQNLQATILLELGILYKINLLVKAIGAFSSQFMKNYITIIQFFIIPNYSPLN